MKKVVKNKRKLPAGKTEKAKSVPVQTVARRTQRKTNISGNNIDPKIKSGEKLASDKPSFNKQNTIAENEGDSYLAKWIAPSFVLTNGEMLIYRLCALGSPLMVVWSFASGSYVVLITFLLAFAVSVIHLFKKPDDIECLIDVDGIRIGDRVYDFVSMESFEVDENSNMLKFKLKNAFFPTKEVYLDNQDPNYIRAALGYFLPEEKQEAVILNREKKYIGKMEEMSDEEYISYLEKMEKKLKGEDY